MTISYSWLKNYIDADITVDETAKILTAIGLEVEGVEEVEAIRGGLKGVVVGHVLTCEQHPDADKLSVTRVDVGIGEPLQIVCGAPNVAMGQKVPVATIGTTLYFSSGEEIKIKKSKLRGVESQGMICAEDELGIGTSHDGIMVLKKDAPVGQPISTYLKLESETVFEVGLTPNRIDAASHIGVARDLAAYLKAHEPDKFNRFQYPSVDEFKVDNASNPYQIKVENSEACPRYTGITISGIKVQPSPEWLQKKLTSIGLRPINNVVDITNFILHEIGQPLHAFDADKIDGKTVMVKTCPEGTPFTTLDGRKRKLFASDLMICSAARPLCIAGVFGGIDSGVTESTQNVFLESAYFNSVWIRKTAKQHLLNTDASFRYERGADPNITAYALKRAALLIKEIAGGQISSDIVDVYPKPIEEKQVEMSYDYICKSAGKVIPAGIINDILIGLEYKVEGDVGNAFQVKVPTYRVDVTRNCDVLEDILRVYGYNNVEIPTKVNSTLSYLPKPNNEVITNLAAELLTCNGFNEIMCLSLTNSKRYDELTTYPSGKLVMLQNPNSLELNSMRQTLLFGGLETIAYNINRKQSNLKLYEFGNVYSRKSDAGSVTDQFSEIRQMGIWITGAENESNWNETSHPSNFFTLRKYVELLLQRFGMELQQLQEAILPTDIYADGIAYKLMGKPFIELGIVSKKLRNMADVKQEVYYAQIQWRGLLNYISKCKITYTELPKYPEVRRDLALLVNSNVTFSKLRDVALKADKKYLKNISLFDVYEGDKLPEGKKSYALSFTLQDNER
ncbi:MAG: phenylalanine--tRNA ligase subunit beta, partial [Prevotellaceae bacterium]|nr:phenylalanine--tRNA ligase subunit beta [Prevotellaceae bacterium]